MTVSARVVRIVGFVALLFAGVAMGYRRGVESARADVGGAHLVDRRDYWEVRGRGQVVRVYK